MSVEPNNTYLLDSLNTAIVVVNEALEIKYLNSAAEALLAISKHRVANSVISDYIGESEQAINALHNAMAQHHQFTKRQARWRLHTGQLITVDYSVTPHVDLPGLVLEIQPLDRLLKITREEAVSSAQETTRNLIRGMAHEIKNPLGGIRGAAQLLARELDNPELHEYTDVIISESDRLRNLVDRMLGPRQLPRWTMVNIHEVLERVATLINAESRGLVMIERDYDPSIPNLSGDEELLIQALLNIVRNAMQALAESDHQQPVIILRSRIQRQFSIGRRNHPLMCRIDIEDNGPGINPELLEDIFYPMISGRAEGSGLGLAISQQLVKQHHGQIICESTPGHTQFSIYLPMESGHAENE